jgi:hypothetical protein
VASVVSGCGGPAAPSGPPVDAVEYKGGISFNPRLDDGRLIHLGFEGHHPTCFVFAAGAPEGGPRPTEEVACPPAAQLLHACPGGLLFPSRKRLGCICVPAGEDAPHRVDCPK